MHQLLNPWKLAIEEPNLVSEASEAQKRCSQLYSNIAFVLAVLLTLRAGFATRRVRYMFATNMPNSLRLLILNFNFSFNHKPQAISVLYTPNCVAAVFRSQLNWSYANSLLVCF